jgi:aminoglycoside phosphotransferase (APT) family kinase protein
MATDDTDARRAAFESAHDIDHALRAIDARLETIEPVPQPIELHTRLYDV